MKKEIAFQLKTATTAEVFEHAANLFREYAASLDINLCFQNFDKELTTLNTQYNQPEGALLLAYSDGKAIGCVGIRRLSDERAELKRMYVQPAFRGLGIAQQMLDAAFSIAAELHYKKICLDTLGSMKAALKLYHVNGFYAIPAYYYNPQPNVVFLEKDLKGS